jgi:hypothetical protein
MLKPWPSGSPDRSQRISVYNPGHRPALVEQITEHHSVSLDCLNSFSRVGNFRDSHGRIETHLGYDPGFPQN